jgi:tRNA-modifying protein YgfZ
MSLIHLASRGVVRVSGPDAATLLNGLLTNDVNRATNHSAIYAAMLTPQGKYLFDMFVLAPEPDVFVLDVARASDFAKRLTMYRLRSKVTIEDQSADLKVYAALPDGNDGEGTYKFADPRLPGLGNRIIAPACPSDEESVYRGFCLNLGVPNPAIDLLVEKDFIMEGLFDELQGLDHHKGCYVGQEMTSRMKRRTSVKNKLCRVRFDGDPPPFETPIEVDGWEVGRMRSGVAGVGIAMIRFDRARKALADGQPLMAGQVAVTLDPPNWLLEPETSAN